MVSFRSLSVLGTRSASSTVAVLMSILSKSSKLHSSFWGETFFAASAFASASFSARMRPSLEIWASISLSSIFENSSSACPSLWPEGSS